MSVLNAAKKKILDGDIVFNTDTIKVALLDNTFSLDIDTQEFFADVSGDELPNGNGYTSGGETLGGKSTTVDNANDRAEASANNVTWASANWSGTPARYFVVYKDTGNPATSPIIDISDFGADQAPANVDYTIKWNNGTSSGTVFRLG